MLYSAVNEVTEFCGSAGNFVMVRVWISSSRLVTVGHTILARRPPLYVAVH